VKRITEQRSQTHCAQLFTIGVDPRTTRQILTHSCTPDGRSLLGRIKGARSVSRHFAPPVPPFKSSGVLSVSLVSSSAAFDMVLVTRAGSWSKHHACMETVDCSRRTQVSQTHSRAPLRRVTQQARNRAVCSLTRARAVGEGDTHSLCGRWGCHRFRDRVCVMQLMHVGGQGSRI
jgi:hypothetical protein